MKKTAENSKTEITELKKSEDERKRTDQEMEKKAGKSMAYPTQTEPHIQG
jgi:hypothetical protein